MSSKAWADLERTVARKIGGVRNIEKGVKQQDVEHPLFSIECKLRASLPALLMQAFGQARGNAKDGQIPLVVLKQARSKGEVVCLDLDAFIALIALQDAIEEGRMIG
jgi:hypothetical protein